MVLNLKVVVFHCGKFYYLILKLMNTKHLLIIFFETLQNLRQPGLLRKANRK